MDIVSALCGRDGFKKMKKQKILAFTGIIAALYVVINTVFGAFSFGMIQLRISNILYQLVPYNKKYTYGIILGVFIANMFSPLGWYDLVFGVGTTICGLSIANMFNRDVKNVQYKQWITTISVTLSTILVAIELNLVLGLPIVPTFFVVSMGQFISQIIGILIMRSINRRFDLTK